MAGTTAYLFIIHYTSAKRKWLLSITTTNTGVLGVELDDYGNADPDYIFNWMPMKHQTTVMIQCHSIAGSV